MDRQQMLRQFVTACIVISCMSVYSLSASPLDQNKDTDGHSAKIVKRAVDLYRFNFKTMGILSMKLARCREMREYIENVMAVRRTEQEGESTTEVPLTEECVFLIQYIDMDKSTVMTAVGEQAIRIAGGARHLTLDDVFNMGGAVVYSIPPAHIKNLQESVFLEMLNMISLHSNAARTLATVDNPYYFLNTSLKGFDPDIVVQGMLLDADTAKLKAICQRAFQMYKTPEDLNSEEGWFFTKYLLFCAPTSVCRNIDNSLIQRDVDVLGFQPWVCHDKPRNIGRTPNYIEILYKDLEQRVRELYASNKPCGKILAEKLMTGGNMTYEINTVANVTRLRSLAGCLPEKTLKTSMDKVGCEFSTAFAKHSVLNKRLTAYSNKKCAQPPKSFEALTCDSMMNTYKAYLPMMKFQSFKRIPTSEICKAECVQLFRDLDDFPTNLMKYTMRKCFAHSNMTSNDISALGSMVVDLPLTLFDMIPTTDLVESIQTIKKLGKSSSRKHKRSRRVVYKRLAQKMIADGKIASLVDSEDIMKGVSLKQFKSVLSESTNVLENLGLQLDEGSWGLTASQKRWVMKELIKEKDPSSMTVVDIRGMKSLVTGMMSSYIKEMAVAQLNLTGQMLIASQMCTYSNWPRKSITTINQDLIKSILTVRNQTNPFAALTVVDIQQLGCHCLLDFKAKEYEDMNPDVCSSLCQKIGNCNDLRCLNPTSRKNVLQSCLMCKNLGNEIMTQTDYVELGPNLVAQMSGTQISMVPAEVLHSHVEYFKYMCLTKPLRIAVSEGLQKVIGRSAELYTADFLYLLGSAIRLLPVTIHRELDMNVIADMNTAIMEQLMPNSDDGIKLKECCEKWLDSEDKAHLQQQTLDLLITMKQALFSLSDVSSTSMVKRSTVTWTCSQIRANLFLFLTSSAEDILAIPDDEFIDCLADIGTLTGLNDEQKSTLLAKAKTALKESNVCSMEVSNVVDLGVVALAFSNDELSCLPLNDDVLLTSLGGLEGWSEAKQTALAMAYMSYQSSSYSILSEDISMLGPIFCGLDQSLLENISPILISENANILGNLPECSLSKMSIFRAMIVQPTAYGPVSTWDAAVVEELKFLLLGLTNEDVQALSVDALEGLDVAVIPMMPVDIIKTFSKDQIESLTATQASAVTETQKAAMTEENRALLETQANGGEIEIKEIKILNNDPTPPPPNSDSSSVLIVPTMLIILAMTVTSVL